MEIILVPIIAHMTKSGKSERMNAEGVGHRFGLRSPSVRRSQATTELLQPSLHRQYGNSEILLS